ncbi:TonB-dependent receptor [Salinimicrobium sp. TIG7-5_MAKvit]|uniref:TonB-dependent receptor n=1 Tax=Salinimicrobium sp. TIG7-5_MAKvit TaxID=3121289 RepID=UPI003C6DF80C
MYLSTPYKILLLLLAIFSFTSVKAQTITGTVINHKKSPVSEAYIYNLNNENHAHTSSLGQFSLQAKAGDSIRVSHMGYKTLTFIAHTGKNNIDMQEKLNLINEVVLTPRLNSLEVFSKVNININPVTSSQDLLRKVPGLIIGQHAGGGKAEQIFLRGFDIDHGTDISIGVDGMPVNLVSHAHGQGYSDLHFLIPETIEGVAFGKGPYNAEKGNFATAGFVSFKTKDRLENNLIKAEAGQFNSQRLLGMFSVLNKQNHSLYLASEYLATDGPFESPQHFNRINLMAKYAAKVGANNSLKASISNFSSIWDASGQIPVRAVESGMISRFGAIDDTEGGETSRTNLIVEYDHQVHEKSFVKNNIYYSKYDFLLFSNFTFFLEDPEFGDQIKQQETRTMMGLNSEYNNRFNFEKWYGDLQAGISLRNDQSEENELSHTYQRLSTLSNFSLGDINETNLAAYINAELHLGKWTINPGIRIDHFNFKYYDRLAPKYATLSEEKSIISPKLNFLYNAKNNLQLYLKAGKGFHSNDTRVVLRKASENILPAAYGSDLGMIWKPVPRMMINTAFWYLLLEQEFVYVGDAGIVEPSGKTERKGIDFSLQYQPLNWLYGNLDATYTVARSLDVPGDSNYIPLAPDFTLTGGLNVDLPSGINSGISMRHLSARPANEDNSIVAEGYTVFDFNLGYKFQKWHFGVNIQNLFDTEWNETQFATESRLSFETEPVEEIHFTPGTPFFLRGIISYTF